jgi:hypothetical protein
VIVVDDRLSIDALAGLPIPTARGGEPIATTWCFHFRLVRALADERVAGHLSRAMSGEVRARAAEPPPGALVVLDPRLSTAMAATYASKHGLNLLAAELLAAAKLHRARVVVSAPNVGRGWRKAFDAERVTLDVG